MTSRWPSRSRFWEQREVRSSSVELRASIDAAPARRTKQRCAHSLPRSRIVGPTMKGCWSTATLRWACAGSASSMLPVAISQSTQQMAAARSCLMARSTTFPRYAASWRRLAIVSPLRVIPRRSWPLGPSGAIAPGAGSTACSRLRSGTTTGAN